MSTTEVSSALLNQIPMVTSTAQVIYATRAMEMGIPRREAYRKARSLDSQGKLTKSGNVRKQSLKRRAPFKRRKGY